MNSTFIPVSDFYPKGSSQEDNSKPAKAAVRIKRTIFMVFIFLCVIKN